MLDATSAPVAGAEISLSAQSGGQFQKTVSGVDGTFRFSHVKDGSFQLRALKSNLGTADQSLEVAGRPLRGLDLRLTTGGTITGRLLGLGPADAAGARVNAYNENSYSQGVVYQDGTYRLRDFPPGDWTVGASLSSGRHTAGSVTLEPGAPEAVLDLDLGGDLTLSGVVQVDGASQQAVLSLRLAGTDQGAGGQSQTGPDGSFRMPRLAAGTYTLEAQLLHWDRQMMILQKTVELAEDLVVAVEVVTGRVQGQVVSPEGTPAVGIRIALNGEHRGWTAQSFNVTDAQGRFEIRLPAGEYRLRVNAEDPGNPGIPVQVPAGGVASVQVPFQ
ncbi:MAG TPA: carboxypeptidase-like regulatory domain-containing protein [Thermoanaerobaculia bacterium]|nr:carboxypeptidase-like regulatory domain-containing protein [Thermoanaerobaculia bacterium]